MVDNAKIYYEKENSANELKGFTKPFHKRTKDKKEEDTNIKEVLTALKQKNLVFGMKVAEKMFKKGVVKKVVVSSNCKDISKKKLNHYANIVGAEFVEVAIDSEEFGLKFSKPFLVSVASILGEEVKSGE